MKLDILHALNAEREARRAAVLVTDIESGAQRLVKGADVAKDPLRAVLEKRLRMAKSGMEETAQGRVFLTVYVPSPKLVITGAVHISQTLAPLGAMLGYDVTIVDPRTAFASVERFPDVKLIAEWPDVALPPLNVDRYTAFVALTHDPKIDDPALQHALQRECFYIGALGSKKTHAKRVTRLKEAGISDAALARIHAPIGLSRSGRCRRPRSRSPSWPRSRRRCGRRPRGKRRRHEIRRRPILPCHSGARRRREPGIQKQTQCSHLDSGSARGVYHRAALRADPLASGPE